MKIKVIIDGKKRVLNYKKGMKIVDLARENKIVLSNYIVIVNGNIVPEDEIVKDKDKIEFLKIASGG